MGFFLWGPSKCLAHLCSFGPFLGCLEGFLSNFCVVKSSLPLKMGHNIRGTIFDQMVKRMSVPHCRIFIIQKPRQFLLDEKMWDLEWQKKSFNFCRSNHGRRGRTGQLFKIYLLEERWRREEIDNSETTFLCICDQFSEFASGRSEWNKNYYVKSTGSW